MKHFHSNKKLQEICSVLHFASADQSLKFLWRPGQTRRHVVRDIVAVTCTLDVSPFSHLGNYVARTRKYFFVVLATWGHVARWPLACLATLGDTPNTMSHATCFQFSHSLTEQNVMHTTYSVASSQNQCKRQTKSRDIVTLGGWTWLVVIRLAFTIGGPKANISGPFAQHRNPHFQQAAPFVSCFEGAVALWCDPVDLSCEELSVVKVQAQPR